MRLLTIVMIYGLYVLLESNRKRTDGVGRYNNLVI